MTKALLPSLVVGVWKALGKPRLVTLGLGSDSRILQNEAVILDGRWYILLDIYDC